MLNDGLFASTKASIDELLGDNRCESVDEDIRNAPSNERSSLFNELSGSTSCGLTYAGYSRLSVQICCGVSQDVGSENDRS